MFERTRTSLYGAAPDQRAGRDLRLDLFRGLSLLFIFIDHIPNNVLSYMTLHSIAFSDAAEVFVFISGYAAATVYGKALARQGPIAAAGHIYRRVWQLYVAHIFTFVLFAAAICYAALAVQNQTYAEDFGIENFIDEPQVAIIKALLLQYQPQFLDILPVYMIFLGVFPLVLLLMQRSLPLPLIISAAIYLLTWRFGWQLHSYPDEETWFFNPLAWQFLFVIGATAGYASYSRQMLPLDRLAKLAIAIVAVVAVVNLSWIIHGVNESFPALLFQELSPYVEDKSNLAPLRLVSFLALSVTVSHLVGRNAQLLRRPIAQLFIRCGQHSLQVFCLGILLSVLGQIVLTSWRGDIPMQLAVDTAGFALMVGLAGLLTWYKSRTARGRCPADGADRSRTARRSGAAPRVSVTQSIRTLLLTLHARAGVPSP